MSHLGDLAAALVDNELSHDARDKALSHVTGCDECRLEVDRQRRLRSMLANQADPEMPAGLAAKLLAIADQPAADVSVPRRRRSWPILQAAAFAPASTRPTGARGPVTTAPTGRVDRVRGRLGVRRVLAGSAVAIALTAGLATAGGPTATAGPARVPPVDMFVQQHTLMTARLPFGDPGAGVVENVVFGR